MKSCSAGFIIPIVKFSLFGLFAISQSIFAEDRYSQLESASLKNIDLVQSGRAGRPLRTLDLTRLNEKNSTIPFGKYELNLFRITTPNEPLNKLAREIRSVPKRFVKFSKYDSRLTEYPDGAFVLRRLEYQMKEGACATSYSKIPQAEKLCGVQQKISQVESQLSDPKSPKFIQDAGSRRLAIEQLRTMREELISKSRRAKAELNNKKLAPQYMKEIGKEEFYRRLKLNDEELALTLIYDGVNVIEEAFWIPKYESFISGSTIEQIMRSQAAREEAVSQPEEAVIDRRSRTVSYQPKKFLSGFTFSTHKEWERRFAKTINTCLVGCAETYHGTPWGRFHYGLGARFPFKVSLNHRFDGGASTTANLTLSELRAFDAGESVYTGVGLSRQDAFSGKELVAEWGWGVGVKWKLPLVGRGHKEKTDGRDYTQDLPRPFRGGNITPPTPGPGRSGNLTGLEKIFTELDLLGQQANFGWLYAKLHAALYADIASTELSLSVKDNNANRTNRVYAPASMTMPLQLDRQGKTSATIGDVRYALALEVGPGLNYDVGIDLALWSHEWNDTLWFPQYAITIPASGIQFNCHAGTRCTQDLEVQHRDR